jgi:hypothetical protein
MSTTESGNTPMKKTIYGALGLAGACAACCALPIAFPMLAGASLAGAAGWVAGDAMLIAGAAAGVVGLGLFLRRRAVRVGWGASCAVTPEEEAGSRGGCGCLPGASATECRASK